MPWSVAQLRALRRYPQSDEVIASQIVLAEADVDRINPTLEENDPERRDRAVDQLVQIELEPIRYSGNQDGGAVLNSRTVARNRIFQSLVGSFQPLQSRNPTPIYPPRRTV